MTSLQRLLLRQECNLYFIEILRLGRRLQPFLSVRMGVINITDRISYIKATKLPLSSDVFIIEGDECVYLYDVGCNEESLMYIQAIDRPLKVILSHFHPDHTGNLSKIHADTVYGGKATMKYFPGISVVNNKISIDDGLKLEIMPLPASHAKGSLLLLVDSKYAFIGDGIYPGYRNGEKYYNQSILYEEIKLLKSLEIEYIVSSHRHNPVARANEVILCLEKILKEGGLPEISNG